MQIPVSQEAIHDVANWAADAVYDGTTEFEEGTYEQGVLDTLRWMTGNIDSRPDE
jgi:hypothetical protein